MIMVFKRILSITFYYIVSKFIVVALYNLKLISNNYNAEAILLLLASFAYIYINYRDSVPIVKNERLRLIIFFITADVLSNFLYFLFYLYKESRFDIFYYNSFDFVLLSPILIKFFSDIFLFIGVIFVSIRMLKFPPRPQNLWVAL